MEEQVRSESNLVKLCGCQGADKTKITHSGGDNEGVTPVPIPNTEVKPFSADGTWLETARESRSLPDSISLRCKKQRSVFHSPAAAASICATVRRTDRLFRLTSPLTRLPPQAVVRGEPGFHIAPLQKQRSVFHSPAAAASIYATVRRTDRSKFLKKSIFKPDIKCYNFLTTVF